MNNIIYPKLVLMFNLTTVFVEQMLLNLNCEFCYIIITSSLAFLLVESEILKTVVNGHLLIYNV